MPLYHFNIFDGFSSLDREGTELPGWDEARQQAFRFAGEVLKNEAGYLKPGEDWRMEVTNEGGLILCRLDFSMTDSAATMNMPRPTSVASGAASARPFAE